MKYDVQFSRFWCILTAIKELITEWIGKGYPITSNQFCVNSTGGHKGKWGEGLTPKVPGLIPGYLLVHFAGNAKPETLIGRK